MKVTNDKTENSQAFLTIEMEPAEVEESLKESYQRLGQKANIPGFRKGKAPRAVLERYMGKESFLEDTLRHLLPKAYEEALKEQKIEAIAQPEIEVTQTDPIIFKATVPLAPTVTLDDYHKIKVKPETVKITKDDINQTMEQLRHQHAVWEPVKRPVGFNDLVTLNVISNIDGEPFINQEDAQYQVIQDLRFPVPGFAEQLVGLKKGDEKEFKLKLPSDYARSELAGKEPSFQVKVAEVKQEILPELNDDLAAQVSPDLKTLDKLRERLENNLKLNAEEKARVNFEEQVIEAVVSLAQVEFPPIFIEMEIDRLLSEQSRQLQLQGKNLEEYLESIKKTPEQMREELRPVAVKRVTRSLVLGKVAEEEKIEANDSEIDAEIDGMLQKNPKKKEDMRKFLSTPQSRESIRQILMTRKTVQKLVKIAKGTKMSDTKTTKEAEQK